MTANDVEILGLEETLLDSWPGVERERLGPWEIRANGGVTGRANAITVVELGSESAEVAALLDQAEAWYRVRSQPTLVRLTPLAGHGLRSELARREYLGHPSPSTVMVRGLAVEGSGVGGEARPGVVLSQAPDEAWWAMSARSAHERSVLGPMFAGLGGRAVFATAFEDRVAVAIGQGVVCRGHLSVFGMATRQAHRGRGHAGRVMDALERWGVAQGATSALLQVENDNAGAARLYERRGYAAVYGYEYLRAPG